MEKNKYGSLINKNFQHLPQKAMDAQDQPIGKNEKSAACAMKGLYPHSS